MILWGLTPSNSETPNQPLVPSSQLKKVVSGVLHRGASLEASEGLRVLQGRLEEPDPGTHNSESCPCFKTTFQTALGKADRADFHPVCRRRHRHSGRTRTRVGCWLHPGTSCQTLPTTHVLRSDLESLVEGALPPLRFWNMSLPCVDAAGCSLSRRFSPTLLSFSNSEQASAPPAGSPTSLSLVLQVGGGGFISALAQGVSQSHVLHPLLVMGLEMGMWRILGQ